MKGLLRDHEAISSDTQDPGKKLGMAAGHWEGKDGKVSGAHWLASLAESVSSRCGERHCLKY